MLNNGQEAVGFGKDFKVGDRVGYWFDDRYNLCKMRKYELTQAEQESRMEEQ